MKILIVTDAWLPQVNGVVRTIQATNRELEKMGHEVVMITPQLFRTVACPTYPEIRLSLFPFKRVAQIIQAEQADAMHIATEGPLEHVPDPASVIHASAQLLAPGGMVFYSTINRNPKAWALTIGAAEYLLKWIPKGTHQYDTFIKPSELSAMARQSGLEVVGLAGVGYQPWKSKQYPFVPTNDTSVNYMMVCRKPK